MTLPTGSRTNVDGHQARAFTLIELILVMALLLIVFGVAFPSLKGFFKGRNMDAEARRFLALTHYGQSRAVSEGVPMVLWIDSQRKSYGLQVQTGYRDSDDKAVSYTLDKDLEVEAQVPVRTSFTPMKPPLLGVGNGPMIRFLPDGSIGETSPDRIVLRQGSDDEVWIVEKTNRLSYAIQSDDKTHIRR